MYDIVAIGECLIDFVSNGKNGALEFRGFAGGAPANVLAQAAKLGLSTAFIGKAGNDVFGKFLRSTLLDYNIDASSFLLTDEYPTTLAFVSVDGTGERSFAFYRKNTADISLSPREVDTDRISACKIFHFGSVSLTDEPSKSATLEAVRYAKDRKILISFDPNLREMLWDDLSAARDAISDGLGYADIVKLSEEELLFLSDQDSLEKAMDVIYEKYAPALLAVTMGAGGSMGRCGKTKTYAAAYAVDSIDTTGAGDSFMGALLYQVLQSGKLDFSEDELNCILRFSNAAGALSTTRSGAMPAMRGLDDIFSMAQNMH